MTSLSPFWINMAGGVAFDIARPTAEMIVPEAILHQMAMISRWGGNVQFPYSILQHSLLVAEAMPDPAERIYGFIHDWPEAILGADIATPWKLYYADQGLDVNGIERRFMNLIYQRLDLPAPGMDIARRVDLADQRALSTEFRDVVHGKTPHWTPRAPTLPKTIRYMSWDHALEEGHAALDSYLYLAKGGL